MNQTVMELDLKSGLRQALELVQCRADLDESLRQAIEQAEDSKTITPLLKEELKLTILNRRYQSGKGDIVLDEKKPLVKRELTADEIGKKLRRKEQNRRAAERCRVKKKKAQEQLLIEFVQEQQKTKNLQDEVARLQQEKQELQRQLDDHAFTCVRPATPSPSYDDSTVFFPSCFTDTAPIAPPSFGDSGQTGCMLGLEYVDQQDMSLYPPRLDQKTSCIATAAAPEELSDLPQLDDDTLLYLQPFSPDLGRRSISEYNEDILNH